MVGVRRRPESGFTLLEAVVALAVASVGLALAAGLLVATHRLAAQAGLEVRRPAVEGPLELLRVELQSATGVGRGGAAAAAVGAAGSRDRLILVERDPARVIYERDGDRLVRRSGEGAPGRTVVPGLVSWRWFQPATNLVTVEVVYDPARVTGGEALRGPLPVRRGWRTVRITAALRGGGASRGW